MLMNIHGASHLKECRPKLLPKHVRLHKRLVIMRYVNTSYLQSSLHLHNKLSSMFEPLWHTFYCLWFEEKSLCSWPLCQFMWLWQIWHALHGSLVHCMYTKLINSLSNVCKNIAKVRRNRVSSLLDSWQESRCYLGYDRPGLLTICKMQLMGSVCQYNNGDC